jgi:quercetin dioxygenase-like cupin family protein
MELTRRDALSAAVAPLLLAIAAKGQTPPQNQNSPVFVHDLPNLTMEDWQVTVSEITLPPGNVGRAHKHPGFTLVYVLEGEVVAKVSGSPEATYSVGQMFYEHPGSTHEVSKNASQTKPAKILALIFAKKGLPLTSPA